MSAFGRIVVTATCSFCILLIGIGSAGTVSDPHAKERVMALSSAGNEEPSQKSYREILREEIEQGVREHRRSSTALLISGLSAGLDVSFSLFLIATVVTLAGGDVPEIGMRFLTAAFYGIGFIFVVLGRSELFTEHTTLAVLPVLNRRSSLRSLARLWALIYVANLVGAASFAWLASWIGPALGVIEPWALAVIAHEVIDHVWWVILMSGVLAGWLMGLLSWLVTAARDTISQIAIIWIITFCIGLAHLHHSIVGTTEVLAAVFGGSDVTLGDFAHFLWWATLGNAFGGVIFVAVIKYSHVMQSKARQE